MSSSLDKKNKKKRVVIFDIDGTLSDASKRLHHLHPTEPGQKKNWKAFFDGIKDDAPIPHIIALNNMYWDSGYTVVLLTGRPTNLRVDTLEWLIKHGVKTEALLMRLTNDRGKDSDVKPRVLLEWLQDNDFTLDDVEAIYEDRVHVAEAFRELGLNVLLVGAEWEPS